MESERVWLNQNVLFFKDVFYGSNCSLEIGLSSSTSDFKTFTPPSLVVSVIDAGYRRTVNLNFQFVVELAIFLEKLLSSEPPQNFTLKVGDRVLSLSSSRSEISPKVFSITVGQSEADFSKVCVTPQVIYSLSNLTKELSLRFVDISLMFSCRTLLSVLSDKLDEVRDLLKVRHVSEPEQPRQVVLQERDQERASEIMSQLESFVNLSLDTIKIPELENSAKPAAPTVVQESSQSDFIFRALNGNVKVLEDFILSSTTNFSIFLLPSLLKKDVTEMLPDISELDLKSAAYISKVFFASASWSYINKKVSFPKSIPVLKYKVLPTTVIPNSVIDLAYDLFVLSGYLRITSQRLSAKESDSVKNKTLIYFAYRCMTDLFCFSFLENLHVETIRSCVLLKFREYQQNGFFRHLESYFESYNVGRITESDINTFVDEINARVLKKGIFVRELHEENYKKKTLVLPYENSLSVEQILNEVVPLEVARLAGVDVTSGDISKFVDVEKMSQEVKELLGKKRSAEKRETNILRFCKFFKDDIPEKYRDSFLDYVSSLTTSDEFSMTKFRLEEFPDSIVKGIYVWNTSQKTEPYPVFFEKFEKCIMLKSEILALPEKKSSESWISSLNTILEK